MPVFWLNLAVVAQPNGNGSASVSYSFVTVSSEISQDRFRNSPPLLEEGLVKVAETEGS